jgi:hypothetical protein
VSELIQPETGGASFSGIDLDLVEAGWISCEIINAGEARRLVFVDELQVTPGEEMAWGSGWSVS